jgi:hypothetical protein
MYYSSETPQTPSEIWYAKVSCWSLRGAFVTIMMPLPSIWSKPASSYCSGLGEPLLKLGKKLRADFIRAVAVDSPQYAKLVVVLQ